MNTDFELEELAERSYEYFDRAIGSVHVPAITFGFVMLAVRKHHETEQSFAFYLRQNKIDVVLARACMAQSEKLARKVLKLRQKAPLPDYIEGDGMKMELHHCFTCAYLDLTETAREFRDAVCACEFQFPRIITNGNPLGTALDQLAHFYREQAKGVTNGDASDYRSCADKFAALAKEQRPLKPGISSRFQFGKSPRATKPSPEHPQTNER